ncbi:hypothetical protein CC77DRAFT_1015889 [Alternaria alternata]|uniref:Uncharacterized protein n=1 Tax=Alternaria alternata TaxID=5599 RepID=A0A177E550_ALTAL|nr:hypothetical protein CC77DRAFT_1015889 [Alternaria alternata]OAG26611.1 hypothetical protein CC77DRAFT_1015889 [Alternaria alternata]
MAGNGSTAGGHAHLVAQVAEGTPQVCCLNNSNMWSPGDETCAGMEGMDTFQVLDTCSAYQGAWGHERGTSS